MARKRRGRSRRPTVDEVLAGTAAVDAGQLMGLINEVNPTGRGLAEVEQRRRYGLKNQLQALLIARHGDDLEVMAEGTAEGTAPGVVSIRRRHAPADACHAVLEQLDDDSRSWVRWQLDEAAAVAGVTAPTNAVETPAASDKTHRRDSSDPLAAGLLALEAYDYELARQLLVEAVERCGGGVVESRALLDLLVNHLGDDVAALGQEASLSAAARRDPQVAVLLAMAAARSGDRPRARALVDGAGGGAMAGRAMAGDGGKAGGAVIGGKVISGTAETGAAAEVWAAMAHGALREDAIVEAEQCLARLRDLAPAHGQLVGLDAELERRKDRSAASLVDQARRRAGRRTARRCATPGAGGVGPQPRRRAGHRGARRRHRSARGPQTS